MRTFRVYSSIFAGGSFLSPSQRYFTLKNSQAALLQTIASSSMDFCVLAAISARGSPLRTMYPFFTSFLMVSKSTRAGHPGIPRRSTISCPFLTIEQYVPSGMNPSSLPTCVLGLKMINSFANTQIRLLNISAIIIILLTLAQVPALPQDCSCFPSFHLFPLKTCPNTIK